MRDRRFGVEIECGYTGEPYRGSRECTCSCECEWERNYFRDDNAYQAQFHPNDPPPHSQEQIDNFECYICRGECEGCYEDDYYDGYEGCEVAARLLYDNGFPSWTDDIHPDGSGVEIPSPILQGRSGLFELRQVMGLLRDNGFDCTRSDGMHVHHDAPEWVEDDTLTAHTIELWEENLPLIHKFVAPSRTNNSMCSSYSAQDDYYYRNKWDEFKRTKDPGPFKSEKFRALNIAHLNRLGSLEIRLHEGTLDFDKASAWIRFGQAFLNFALVTHKRGEILTCTSRTDLLRQTRVSSTTRRRLMAVGRQESAYASVG